MTQKKPDKRARRQRRKTLESAESLAGAPASDSDSAVRDPLESQLGLLGFPGGPPPDVNGTASSAFPGGKAHDDDEPLFPGAAPADAEATVLPELSIAFPGSGNTSAAKPDSLLSTGSFPGGLNSVGLPTPQESAGTPARQSDFAMVPAVQKAQRQDGEGAVTGGQTLVASSKRKKRRNTSS